MITILTATYNAAAHLRHALASLAAQTVPVEHLILDGGSTDATLAIIADDLASREADCAPPAPGLALPASSLAPRTSDLPPRVAHLTTVVSEPDRGLYDALNKGLQRATGDLIGILHADDVYPAADTLAKVAKIFEDPAVEACYGDLLYVREPSVDALPRSHPQGNHATLRQGSRAALQPEFAIVRYWRSGPCTAEQFKWGWMPPHPTFFARRDLYRRLGGFRLDLGTAADYELMLRFLLKERVRCAYSPDILMCMRTGGASNRSLQARLAAHRMDRKAWTVNGLTPYPWTLLCKPLRKLPQWWQRPPRQAIK